jgi:hypothetical protein
MLAVATFSCQREKGTIVPDPPAPPVTDPPAVTVFLKDIVIPNLPSPYYHFEYTGTGKISRISFASDLRMYDVVYDGNRISELKNNILVNKDRLVYSYSNDGRVISVRYVDSTGIVYERVLLSYDGPRLMRLDRVVNPGTGFTPDKTMTMTYDANGNLATMTEHFLANNGQPEGTWVESYAQYDDKINTDGFSLLHDEFFDHLVFLPGVQLQKNNPGRIIRTGDGLNFNVAYQYTYDSHNLPLTKAGNGIITNGADAGHPFQTNSIFSYY